VGTASKHVQSARACLISLRLAIIQHLGPTDQSPNKRSIRVPLCSAILILLLRSLRDQSMFSTIPLAVTLATLHCGCLLNLPAILGVVNLNSDPLQILGSDEIGLFLHTLEHLGCCMTRNSTMPPSAPWTLFIISHL
jgi:hypothetical protein